MHIDLTFNASAALKQTTDVSSYFAFLLFLLQSLLLLFTALWCTHVQLKCAAVAVFTGISFVLLPLHFPTEFLMYCH